MLLSISHETKLTYSAPVSETVLEVRKAPPSDEDQTSLSYRLRIVPEASVTPYRDGFGNRVDLFSVASPYRELTIQSTSVVRTHRRRGRDRIERASWPPEGAGSIEAIEFLQPSPLADRSDQLSAFVEGLRLVPGPLDPAVRSLMAAVGGRLKYEKRVTTARTKASEALELGRGVCQDFAHVFIGACRGLGLAARYVSGYVNHPGEIATHAWCQVWAGPGVGWVDVDPTRGEYPGDDYVAVAVGRDYSDVPPNRGVWKGRAEESIAVAVKVEPVDRVPMEWMDWSAPAPRRAPGQFQSQRAGPAEAQVRRRKHPAYPNQRERSAGLRQQQGQQQQ